MQKRSSRAASAAKTLFVFSFITHCVSAVAITSTGTAVSSRITPPFPTATGYGTGSIPPFPTAAGFGTGISNSLSSGTKVLLSTASTTRSSSSLGSGSDSLSTSSTISSLITTLPTSSGSTTSSTGSLGGAAISSSSNSSLYSVTFGASSIATATVIQSGKIETAPVINGGSYSLPITLPPLTTTLASFQATSSVSSVSSELAGLIPIVNSWKANPTSLKSDTLNKINPVKSDIEDLISNLGGVSASSGCGSKRKRGLLGAIGDIVNRLSCIDEDLDSITKNINADDVDAIDDSLDDLIAENNDLTDEDDDNNHSNSNSNSDSSPSTSESSSSSSASSCISAETALQVTVQCVPTSFSTSGFAVSTTTCSPLTTVTTSGCSVTGLTTTVSTSKSVSITQIACASDTCGDACPMNGGPLSGASMGIEASTDDCASISTMTTSALPTASYGVIGSIAIASPTPESFVAASSKRSVLGDPVGYDRILVDRSMIERALPDVTPPYADYVRTLKPVWVNQEGEASGQWFDYPVSGHAAAGVNGLYGCTSVMIVSKKGVYISHIWEDPVFIDEDFVPTDDNTFTTEAFNALRDGTEYAQSITALVGTEEAAGPLNAIYNPIVFVLTPYTTDSERQLYGITTNWRYEARARQLAQQIVQIVPNPNPNPDLTGFILGYTRTSAQLSTQNPGIAGRAILEVDPFQRWLVSDHASTDSPGLQVGRWRLWVEDQRILSEDFWVPHTTPPGGIQRRDIGYANPCASLASNSSSSVTSPGTSETSSGPPIISSTLVSMSTTSPSGDLNPSSCVYTVTSGIGITTDGYTIQPTPLAMCQCDSSAVAGINTVTGTSSTSYLVCEVPSSITVSTMQPSTTAPPPTPITIPAPASSSPTPAYLQCVGGGVYNMRQASAMKSASAYCKKTAAESQAVSDDWPSSCAVQNKGAVYKPPASGQVKAGQSDIIFTSGQDQVNNYCQAKSYSDLSFSEDDCNTAMRIAINGCDTDTVDTKHGGQVSINCMMYGLQAGPFSDAYPCSYLKVQFCDCGWMKSCEASSYEDMLLESLR